MSEKGGDADKSTVAAVIEKIIEELVSTTKVSLAMLQSQEKKTAAEQAPAEDGAAPPANTGTAA
jgi:hypothetical protein